MENTPSLPIDPKLLHWCTVSFQNNIEADLSDFLPTNGLLDIWWMIIWEKIKFTWHPYHVKPFTYTHKGLKETKTTKIKTKIQPPHLNYTLSSMCRGNQNTNQNCSLINNKSTKGNAPTNCAYFEPRVLILRKWKDKRKITKIKTNQTQLNTQTNHLKLPCPQQL